MSKLKCEIAAKDIPRDSCNYFLRGMKQKATSVDLMYAV